MKLKIAFAAAAALAPLTAAAQDSDPLVTFQVLAPEVAQAAATAAMQHCSAGGYQVGGMVVDRFGVPQSFIRDRFAGPHVFETAYRKAWTSVSFRTSTLELAANTLEGLESSGIRHISMALPLGGGLPINSGDGSMLGGIGVSGAPQPGIDEECAQAGIDAIDDLIAF